MAIQSYGAVIRCTEIPTQPETTIKPETSRISGKRSTLRLRSTEQRDVNEEVFIWSSQGTTLPSLWVEPTARVKQGSPLTTKPTVTRVSTTSRASRWHFL